MADNTSEQLIAAVAELEEKVKALTDAPRGDFPVALDLRNQQGDLLHVRGTSLKNIEDVLIEVFGEGTTRVMIQSFSYAVRGTVLAGGDVNAALDEPDGTFESDSDEALAYETLKSAPPPRGASRGGGGSGGGGGSAKIKAHDGLPEEFLDELKRGERCPECGGDEFFDNRPQDGKGPHIKCANAKCDAGKGYPWGWWPPKDDGGRGRGRGSRRSD